MRIVSPVRRFKTASAFVAVCLLSITLFSYKISGQDITWRPITPAELAATTPVVEADADAEAIFWEIRLDDKNLGKLTYSHYVRVKIFTERGRERFAKMDIPFEKGRKIEKVAARVIKPDGGIVDLKPEDIFEREIAKAGKAKVLAKSFAVPGIEPGVIVEYQYVESIKGDSAAGERLVFQRDIPMQAVTYYVRPYSEMSLNFNAYNMPGTSFNDEKKGFKVATLNNVPAFKDEPYMPPDDEVRKWVFLSYITLGQLFQWNSLGQEWKEGLARLSKPNKEVKAKAAELTTGVLSEEERIRRIYEFIQKQMKNISFDRTLSDEQIEKLNVKDADDALKRGMGSSFHLDMLFASLAKAAGFDVQVVLAADRSENFFSPEKYPFRSFVQMSGISVKIGNTWQFFDPCAPYMPFGMVPWNRENVKAMVVGESGFTWTSIPMSDEKRSPASRDGKFELLADGTLQGSIRIEYDGHQAISRRRDEYRNSPAKREENIKEEIKSRLDSAEISDLSIENFDDSSKPLAYSFKIKIPNFAQKVGKRMIFQPSVFEYGSKPVFTSAKRTYNIYFPYPWSEKDTVEIKLPKEYALDGEDAPQDVVEPSNIAALKVAIQVDKTANVLRLTRNFHFGGNGKILFPVTAYTPMKNLFDTFQRVDSHSMSLKQKDVP